MCHHLVCLFVTGMLKHLIDSACVEKGSEVEVKAAAASCHSFSVKEKKKTVNQGFTVLSFP